METVQKQSVIESAREKYGQRVSQFRYTLGFVPPEKMEWKPTETAKSAREIVAHCAFANFGLGSLLYGKSLGGAPMGPAQFQWTAEQQSVDRSVEETMVLFDESIAAVDEVFSELTEERLGELSDTPFGRIPVEAILEFPSLHIFSHSAQIDYLQTCWGDLEFHFAGMGDE